jgi:serine/threonine protein kinase/formylglycine-generating enzyme required for sulfatase activity
MTTNATESPSLTEGLRLAGCYTLKRSLSAREEHLIWLAQDEVLGKEVTLHFVPGAVVRDQRAVAELRQEVKRNRQLIHPNILRVYDYVEDAGSAAVSMDKFEGESLAEILNKRGPLDPQEIQPWISQLAETLSDAHRIQLIHRDLAPENLIVRSTGAILLTNFGISRSMRDAMERTGLARGGATHLAYVSPQQVDGDRPTPADDVYGLGALIFELLAGRAPFIGNDLVPQIRKAPVPSINSLRQELGKNTVPESWQKLVEACLAKAADQRPRSCGEVASMIAGSKSLPAANPPAPTRVDLRDAAPARSAPESPAKTPESPAKDSPQTSTSSAKSALPPTPPSGGAAPAPKKAPANLSANYPDLDRPRSKLPVVLVGIAAVVLGAGIYLRNYEPADSTENATSKADGAGGVDNRSEGSNANETKSGNSETPVKNNELASNASNTGNPGASSTGNDNNPPVEPGPGPSAQADPPPVTKPPTPKPLIGADPKPAEAVKPAVVGETKPAVKPPQPPVVTDVPVTPKAVETALVPLPQAPAALPKLVVPTNATYSQLEQLLAERQAAAEKASEVAKAADNAAKENAKIRDARLAEEEKFKKTYDERRKGLAQIINSGLSVETDTAKMKESMEKAKAAALEAVKQAEAAEKAFNEFTSQSGQKLAAKSKAEADLRELVQASLEKGKGTEELNAQVTKAESLRQQMALSLRQLDQDKAAITAKLEKARAAEVEAMRKANREKIAAIEAQIKPLEAEATKVKALLGQLKDLGAAGAEAAKPLQQQLDAVNTKISAFQDEIKALNNPTLSPKPTSTTTKPSTPTASAPPTPTPPTPTPTPPSPAPTATVGANNTAAISTPLTTPPPLPANPETPSPLPVSRPPVPSPAPAETTNPGESLPPAPAVNSVGMKFAEVGNVQFAIHPTTREQFEAFAKASNLKNNAWQNPWFQQGPDHPVVNVTWREADAFCKWLTERERKSGLLKPGEFYRLPTDVEWSKAVGLPEEKGGTPEERDMGVQNVYPWGSQWPPPPGAGNYAGEETKGENPIPGYNDNYENTSPVGKFKPTTTGLYDMSGNVWQWVSDDWNGEKRNKTLRGGSWYNGAIQLSLLSSCRIGSSPDNQNDTYGFRIVKAAGKK